MQNTTQANRQQELNWFLQDKLDKRKTLTEESKTKRRPGYKIIENFQQISKLVIN